MTIEDLAERVVIVAGEHGGSDEVKRIADRGWPGDVIIASRMARDYEDHDDCLAAVVADVARETGMETWELTAEWDDDKLRDAIIVRSTSRDLLAAIQQRARARFNG